MSQAYRGIVFETIRAWVEDDIGFLQFYRPKAMNAVNGKLMDEAYEATMMFQEDPAIKVIIVCGTEHAFAAGADIAEVANYSAFQARDHLDRVSRNFFALEDHPKPIIAAVRGIALGGGFECMLSCDIIIVAEDALLGLPEIKLGVFPGGGGTQRFPRNASIYLAKQYIFTGDFIKAEEAFRMGLVNFVVPSAEVMAKATKMAKRIARNSPLALREAKNAINMSMNTDIKSGVRMEQLGWSMLFSSQDQKEGMKAFQENRKPAFNGR